MSAVTREAEHLFERMTRQEKERTYEKLWDDLNGDFPGIKSTPGVCGGVPRIGNHRIPVWSIWNARRLGISDKEILSGYPGLTSEDLQNAYRYAREHLEETERLIAENEFDDEVLAD